MSSIKSSTAASMSTSPFAIQWTPQGGSMQTLKLPNVSLTNLTPLTLIAQINSSFYGGVPVALALTTSPTVLIASTAKLNDTGTSPGWVLGTEYTYVLVAVARYQFQNFQDSNSGTNLVNVDYVPGVSYIPSPTDGSAPTPSRFQVISDAITAFNAAITAYNTANSTTQKLWTTIAAVTSNLTGNAVSGSLFPNSYWGFYTAASAKVFQDTFVPSGNYIMAVVQHYILNVPHQAGSPMIAEYLTAQTAGTLIAASGVTAQANPFPGLFLDSSNPTDANIASTLLANTAVVTGNTYDVDIVYNYKTVLPAANGNAEVDTTIQTLEAQTPLYLLTQLITLGVITGSASSYRLQPTTPANAPLANQLLALDPTLTYNIVSVVTISVDYTSVVASSSPISVATLTTATLEQFMKDPSLAPIFQGAQSNQMVVLVGTKGNNSTFLSPGMLISAVLTTLVGTYGQTAPNYTLYWGVKAFNTITVSMPGSTMAPFVDMLPQGDSYVNVLTLAMAYFGVKATSTINYALFDTVTVTNQYGFNSDSTQGQSKTIASSDSTKLTMQTCLSINLAVTAQSPVAAWVPNTFNIGQAITYFLNATSTKSAAHLPLSAASSDHMWTLAEYNTPGSTSANSATETPIFMPWEMVATASPDLQYVVNTTPSGKVTLNTDNQGTLALSDISLNYTGAQYIRWALKVFPGLDPKATYVVCLKVSGQVPAFSVSNNNNIVALLTDTQLGALTPAQTTNNVYIMKGMPIDIAAPPTITRTDITATLPEIFTNYDLVNYALPIFGLTGITSYAFYETTDPLKQTLGIDETIKEVEVAFPSDNPLHLSMIPSTYAQVTVTFNGVAYVLLPMPVSCTIDSMLEVAAVTLNVPKGSLEVTTASVLSTDLISQYTTPSLTAGGLATASFFIGTKVLTDVMIFDSQTSYMVFSKKISQITLVSQLIAMYRAAQSIPASYEIDMFTYTTNVAVPTTAAVQSYERSIQPSDVANLDPNNSTAVSTVVQFTAHKTQQFAPIVVQSLFNASKSISVNMPLFSTAAQLTAAAVSAFGNLSSTATFGVILAGTSSSSTIAPTALVDASNVYQLVETTSVKQYAYVSINYTDRSIASVNAVVSSSTVISSLSGFNPKFESLSLSQGGSALSSYSATVAATLTAASITNSQLILYDTLLPDVVVHALISGTLKMTTVPVNSKISDMLTAFSVTGNVIVTITPGGAVAALSSYVIDAPSPYTFTITPAPTTFNVTVNYGTQSTVVAATAAFTVSQVISAAVSQLALPATQQYNLSLTSGGAALVATGTQDWSTVSTVYLSQAGVLNNTLLIGGGIGILAIIAALLISA